MKKRKQYGMILMLAAFSAACFAFPALAQKKDVGYRKLMLGQSRDQIRQVVQGEFAGEYAVSSEGSDTMVLTKKEINTQVAVIALVFDYNNILYKINVKMRKNRSNPPPDEVVKVIEAKYGPPAKRTISNALDLTAYWYPDNNRHEIFFQNITSWDKYEVQYTDTLLQKRKEERDRDRNKKPVDKNLDF